MHFHQRSWSIGLTGISSVGIETIALSTEFLGCSLRQHVDPYPFLR
jgi:hypothetical protein